LGKAYTYLRMSGAVSSDFQSDSTDDENAWITWFVNLKGNEFFCEVDSAYIQDGFNLTGLSSQVSYYDYALDMILDIEAKDQLSEEQQERVENDAENLYGLIHARYILTTQGLHAMLEKISAVSLRPLPSTPMQGSIVSSSRCGGHNQPGSCEAVLSPL